LVEKIEGLYAEIGVYCPFVLARHLGIEISHSTELDQVYGLYTKTSPETVRLFINSSIQSEYQEDICEQLIKHHLVNAGQIFCISANEYTESLKDRKFGTFKRLISRSRTLRLFPT
jgi:hypothetical protein